MVRKISLILLFDFHEDGYNREIKIPSKMEDIQNCSLVKAGYDHPSDHWCKDKRVIIINIMDEWHHKNTQSKEDTRESSNEKHEIHITYNGV